ncbi:XkdQ/YqbQ family protein [Clostridium rectalis]|uniref:XkdQ/YqbQ family protein n=1 Tax=Clostridium rectalis TaxID=2040295 RepID=UPI000F63F46D|nr:terminase [Clostridium rectalis]
MIKIYTEYNKKNITDITPFCKSISISGDRDQCARTLQINILYSIFDKNHVKTQINPGTKVWVFLNGMNIFSGIVFDRSLSSTGQEIQFTAYDYLIYLLQNTVTYNFNKMPSFRAVEKVITDLGIKCNKIPKVNIPITRLITDKSAYEAIMEIYTQIYKRNGKMYIPVAEDTKVSIIEKGSVVTDFVIQSTTNNPVTNNVLSLDFSDSMSEMVNRVLIYDENGKFVGKVEDSNLFPYYGIMQRTYQKEENTNPYSAAKTMLHGVDRNLTVQCLGNWNCRTGYAVNTKVFYLNNLQNNILYIDSDTHTFEVATGKYTMQLTLNYENKMDIREE